MVVMSMTRLVQQPHTNSPSLLPVLVPRTYITQVPVDCKNVRGTFVLCSKDDIVNRCHQRDLSCVDRPCHCFQLQYFCLAASLQPLYFMFFCILSRTDFLFLKTRVSLLLPETTTFYKMIPCVEYQLEARRNVGGIVQKQS